MSGRQIVRRLIIYFGQPLYFWRTGAPGHLVLGVELVKFSGL